MFKLHLRTALPILVREHGCCVLGYRSNFVVQKHSAVRPRLAIDCRIVVIFERTLSKLLRGVVYLMYMCAFMLQVGERKAVPGNFVQNPTPSELIKKGADIDLWKSCPAFLQYVDVERGCKIANLAL